VTAARDQDSDCGIRIHAPDLRGVSIRKFLVPHCRDGLKQPERRCIAHPHRSVPKTPLTRIYSCSPISRSNFFHLPTSTMAPGRSHLASESLLPCSLCGERDLKNRRNWRRLLNPSNERHVQVWKIAHPIAAPVDEHVDVGNPLASMPISDDGKGPLICGKCVSALGKPSIAPITKRIYRQFQAIEDEECAETLDMLIARRYDVMQTLLARCVFTIACAGTGKPTGPDYMYTHTNSIHYRAIKTRPRQVACYQSGQGYGPRRS
jgi:hypothetical protein